MDTRTGPPWQLHARRGRLVAIKKTCVMGTENPCPTTLL